MVTSTEELGHVDYSVKGFTLGNLLAAAPSSLTFRALDESDEELVLKIFTTASGRQRCTSEFNALERLSGLNVPQALYQTFTVQSHLPVLVLSPSGTIAQGTVVKTPLAGQYLSAVVRILQRAHAAQVFHRDLRPDNIVVDDNGNTFLNDWSSAYVRPEGASADLRIPWAGSHIFSVSQKGTDGRHVPTAADDLRSLVRCAVVIIRNLDTTPIVDVDKFFRTFIDESGMFKSADTMASELDYDGVSRLLSQF